MMKLHALLLASAFAFAATSAGAQTVHDTDLAALNTGTAVTTTTANGTTTTVSGARQSAPVTTGAWQQANVGGGATVGITRDYARNGNGSAYFATTDAGSKADLQYYFAAPVALSSLNSVSFDWYRDGASTAGVLFAPVLRFDIFKTGEFAGSLVFENYYQGEVNAATDSWTTLTATLNSGDIWATNAKLGPTFAAANGGEKTFQQWLDDNGGAELTVYGVSIGVGSGWSGAFTGAVDNVAFNFTNGPSANFNFEVAAGVPEPASWALMIAGFGLVGGALRRRTARPATVIA